MTHPTESAFDLWVAGMLEGPEAAAFEAHVDGCAECAARLSVAARAELELFDVAEAARPRARRRWPVVVAAAVALAAVALLVVRSWSPARVVGVDVSIDCSVATDRNDCEQRAARRGLMVSPDAVPRYEAAACSECGAEG
jgi:hypothetical protein